MKKELLDYCEIYFNSYQIPVGIFNHNGELVSLFSSWGQKQTDMYLEISKQILSKASESDPGTGIDREGSCWASFSFLEEYILIGPVQTGLNPRFLYDSVPEYTGNTFLRTASNLYKLFFGKDAELTEYAWTFRNEQRATVISSIQSKSIMYRSFDEIYDCIRKGDVEEVKRITQSREYSAYNDTVMTDLESGRTVFMFCLAKCYHTASEVIRNSDLEVLLRLNLKEMHSYTTIAAIKSASIRMIYDFANQVNMHTVTTCSIYVNKVRAYIRQHLYESISLEDIARYCALSVSAIQHRFKAETGITISKEIQNIKIEKACFLLKYTALSGTDIAFKLGYCSQSYFNKQFLAVMGITPIAYRMTFAAQ